MKYSFADRATAVPSAGIALMMNYAAKYEDVISLGQGTPLFPTPPFIYEYLYNRSKIDGSIGMYSGPKIENELKEFIVLAIEKSYGFKPTLQEICLTVGGIGGLFASIAALLQRGDEIIYFTPSYPLHISQIHIAEAKIIYVPYDENKAWSIDLAALKKAVNKSTKAIVLTNPNNPTGTILSEKEVRELEKIVLENNLILILDEAYEFLTYENKLFSPLKIPELRNNIILSKSFSKEFAMTGWRIGYLYANQELLAKINDIHFYYSIGSVTPSVVAAIAALSDPRGHKATEEFKKKFAASRDAICQRLRRLPKLFSFHKPQGVYYVFPRILGFENMPALDFAKLLVDEAKVITIPGDSMGPAGKRHLRMSFAADPSVINKAFDRIDYFAEKYHMK